MNTRTYMSIGDVLSLLREEFPDVTISKIRFLESQGLVNPERTPSGYRKFYEHDVERLRWVLRQQREHFLPLKVIKGRLEDEGEVGPAPEEHPARASTSHLASSLDPARVRAVPALVGRGGAGDAQGGTLPGFEAVPARPQREVADTPARGPRSGEAQKGVVPGRADVRSVDGEGRRGAAPHPSAQSGPSATLGAPVPPGETTGRGGGGRGGGGKGKAPTDTRLAGSTAGIDPTALDPGATPPMTALSGTSMTLDELAAAAGLSVEATEELEAYGLVRRRTVGGVAYYDEDALIVARLAAGFAAFGVQARHLRLHKHAAEREAGFIEQIVLPLLRQRNPEARQRAQETTAELSRLGQGMRAVQLRSALRDVLGG
jgi:DNA-binding transcriptional MerR regulator